ncbi:RelB, partial [Lactiplantibacillus plantarum]
SPAAFAAKKEAETGQVKNIGSLTDFEDWIDKLDAN